MINDVTDAFGEWLQSITITRQSPGAYIEGRYKDGSESEVSIRAVVQNATPDDLQVLEEGLRSSESVKLHTTSDLVALSEKDNQKGDTFTYKGKKWSVHNVARRFIGNYNKAIAIRIKDES